MRIIAFAFALLFAAPLQAAMVSRPIEYEVGGQKMQSMLIYDDATKTPRPGLVMTPDWMGMTPANLALARQIAGSDYVILVADVYGAKLRPQNIQEAAAASKVLYGDRASLRARIHAALDQLRAQQGKAPLDGRHWGAIGFCFGGTATLDLVRSGAEIGGAVTFHAGLSADVAFHDRIKAPILVLHGADDPFESAQDVADFEREMRAAGADWQLLVYGGAMHCFAIPGATGTTPGCKYDERTAKRAFAQMRRFFADEFAG